MHSGSDRNANHHGGDRSVAVSGTRGVVVTADVDYNELFSGLAGHADAVSEGRLPRPWGIRHRGW